MTQPATTQRDDTQPRKPGQSKASAASDRQRIVRARWAGSAPWVSVNLFHPVPQG
jgi:hypothetical protein